MEIRILDVNVIGGLIQRYADDGYLHAAVGGQAVAKILRVGINELLKSLAIERMGAAMRHQGIIQIGSKRRFLLSGEPKIPQRSNVHHDMPVHGIGMLHGEQIADPQRVLHLVEGRHLLPFPMSKQIIIFEFRIV